MENLDLDFLAALANVIKKLENSTLRYIEPSTLGVTPSNRDKAITNILKEHETITVTTGGWVVKPNGKLQLLSQEVSSLIKQKKQKEKDHLIGRIKDIGSLVLSSIAIVISIISMIISCSQS